MRYDADHKAQTRTRILDQAGALVRRAGLSQLGIERTMKAAGLTVGGFYNHFGTRQRFLADTLRHMLTQSRARLLEGLTALSGQEFLEAFVRRYLSRSLRDDALAGCPLPATLSELPQSGPKAQQALAEQLELLIAEIAQRLPEPDAEARRQRALGLFAQCVGGLTLARALGDTPLSEELLRACRRMLIPPRRKA
jgi:TetR/AcrR family transcriptional repressor of nem operon